MMTRVCTRAWGMLGATVMKSQKNSLPLWAIMARLLVVAFCYFGAEFYFYFLLFLAHNCLLFMVYSLGFWFIVDG